MISSQIEQIVSLHEDEPPDGDDVRLLLSSASTVEVCVRLVEVSVSWQRLWAMRLAGVALNRLLAQPELVESMELRRAVATLTSTAFRINDGALTQSSLNAIAWLVESESGLENVSFDQSEMVEFILRTASSDHPNDRSSVFDLLERVTEFGSASELLGEGGAAALREAVSQMKSRNEPDDGAFPFELQRLVNGLK